MNDPLPLDVVRALDILVLERTDEFTFVPVTPPPRWASQVLTTIEPGAPLTLRGAFPLLDRFLSDADDFWRDGTEQVLTSAAVVVPAGGEELLLRACALNLGPRSVLAFERLRGDADMRPLLQKARENRLVQERLQQCVDMAQAPLAAVTTLLHELTSTELTAAQREIAGRLEKAVARLQSAIAQK